MTTTSALATSSSPTRGDATTQDDRLESNLAALSGCGSSLADRLANVSIPPTVTPDVGRDGSPTFRIEDTSDDWHWFGRTSMPTIRASALVDTLHPDGSNVLLPAIGTGHEALELLLRTPSYCAVFVYEDNMVLLRLALTLNDFSQFIRSRRLIFLDGEDPSAALTSHFTEHPGLELPQKILLPPHVASDRTESFRAAIAQAAGPIARMQTERARAFAGRLASRVRADSIGRLAVLSVDPRAVTIQMADSVHSAAVRAGLEASECVPDRPDRCHSVARLQALVETDADAALLMNCGWGSLQGFVPEDFPAAAWLLPNARINASATGEFNRVRPIYVATPELQRSALAAGLEKEHVRLLEPASDDALFHPFASSKETSNCEGFDVACVGDVGSLEAEACGIALETHVHLWKFVCTIAERGLERAATEVLKAGERASGVELSDRKVRDQFTSLIRMRLFPILMAHRAVRALLAAGIDVRAYGSGWELGDTPADRIHHRPNPANERNALYNAARIVVCPIYGIDAVQTVLDATLAGSYVVYRRPIERLEDLHPQLADALVAIPSFEQPKELVDLVKSYLGDAGTRNDACSQARRIIAERHLCRHRFETIRQALTCESSI